MHLYNLLVELDPDVAVENRYEDESYDPVGGILVYKNHIFMDEDNDFEYPDEDEMDEDEDYDDMMMNFYDSIGQTQDGFINVGYMKIDNGEGNIYVYFYPPPLLESLGIGVGAMTPVNIPL